MSDGTADAPDAPTAKEAAGSWTRPAPRALVWAIVLAVVAGVITWRTVHDERRAAAVGELVQASDALPDARSSFLLVPGGRVDVKATRAVDDVDGDQDVRELQAPDDGSFVGLELTSVNYAASQATGDPLALTGVGTTSSQYKPELALVADGRRYPLQDDDGDALGAPGRWYLAVAGTPSTLELEASVESYRQRVDLRSGERKAGVFAPLYGAATLNRDRPSCGTPTVSDSYRSEGTGATCRITSLLRTPLLAGGGWAPEGKQWLVLVVAATPAAGYLRRASGGVDERYDAVRTPETAVRLDGEAPRNLGGAQAQPGAVAAFLVPSQARQLGTLTVSTTVELSANSAPPGPGYDRPTVTTRWQVAL